MISWFSNATRDVVWWFKCRLMKRHMHHVVHTDLAPGYHDTDMMVLYANMALVKWYLEKDAVIAGDEEEHKPFREMLEWFERYKNSDDEIPTPTCSCVPDPFWHSCEHWMVWADDHHRLAEKYEAEAEEHLVWLMRNRRIMWS